MAETAGLWRVFPWDSEGPPGGPFSPTFIPGASGHGRFDLPEVGARILYLAETPEHAVAEAIQGFRGGTLKEPDLRRAGKPLALCSVQVTGDPHFRVADLCDPEVLAFHGIHPDHLACRTGPATRSVATMLRNQGFQGLRWWSAFHGDWHTTVLFGFGGDPTGDRGSDGGTSGESDPGGGTGTITVGASEPRALTLDTPALLEAAALLGMEVG